MAELGPALIKDRVIKADKVFTRTVSWWTRCHKIVEKENTILPPETERAISRIAEQCKA